MIKWYMPNRRYTTNDLVNVTMNAGSIRISFSAETFQNITPIGQVVLGTDGNRLYFAADPKGYNPHKAGYRKFLMIFSYGEEMTKFLGQHPLFYDSEAKLYYISADNTEGK